MLAAVLICAPGYAQDVAQSPPAQSPPAQSPPAQSPPAQSKTVAPAVPLTPPLTPIANFVNADASAQADALAEGRVTSAALVKAYLARIDAMNHNGPQLNAVIALFPDALDQARVLDAERADGTLRGPLHGIPILLKDNIEAAGPVPTTAGSLALKDNITGRDAPLVARLRAAGLIILGKTNLSEWANIRSGKSTSGWSAVGGLTRNPYRLDRNTCGSSSGSGAAVAARLASFAIGTETDGSIVCPSGTNGIVGFKPTVGLVSRRYIVPISRSQDTAGPMTRSVRDAALMLDVIAGTDEGDPATEEADLRRENYAAALERATLAGVRIGVMNAESASKPNMQAALRRLERQGAVLVPLDISRLPFQAISDAEFATLLMELKADMALYLQGLPEGSAVKQRTLADVIAYNIENAAVEMPHFGQDVFEQADQQPGLDSVAYRVARSTALRLAATEGIDRLFSDNDVDIIIGQTNGPAWISTLGKGDNFAGPSVSTLPAIAGYPHLTVPMGMVDGLPVGLSFIGPKWRDADVLAAGYLFEKSGPRVPAPTFIAPAPPPAPKKPLKRRGRISAKKT